jgi:small-conductance mechanosensitive channel/tellurite resistance protein
MESASDFLEFVGLLAVLASAAVVFVTLARWIAGKRRDHTRLGLEMTVFFTVAYGFHHQVLKFLHLADYADDIGSTLAMLWWLSLAFMLNAALKRFVWNGVLAERGEPRVPRLLTDFVAVAVYLIAIMAAMHFVYGEPITAIAATSGAAAFIVGYSAQTTLGELFAGISLNASGKVKKGDFIQIDDVYGTVHDVDWRTVTIYHYFTESLVVFPNSVLATKRFRNYMHPGAGMRGTFKMSVEFTAPPNLVRRIIVDALMDCPVLLKEPPPFVFIYGPSQFGIDYEVGYCFPGYMEWFDAQDQAMSAVWTALRRHGMRPGVNHHYVGAGGAFDEQGWPSRHAAARVAAMPAAIAAMPLFDGLSAELVATLTAGATCRDHSPPETVLDRDADSGSLYLVGSGAVDLVTVDAAGMEYVAAELGVGAVFGAPLGVGGNLPVRARCRAYGEIYEIPAAVIDAAIAAEPALKSRLAALADERLHVYDGRLKAHAYELRRRQRERDKAAIVSGIASRLGSVFKSGVLGGAVAKRRRELLLDAAMAATALVAFADGEIEPAERQEVITTLHELELLRRAGEDEGIQRFDAYAAKLEADLAAGAAEALASVARLKGDAHAANLVVDICVAISAADGEIEEAEEARIAQIRGALGLAAEADATAA